MDWEVVGPLSLQASETKSLLWLLRAHQMTLASARLEIECPQVAVLTDLQLTAPDPDARQSHAARLMAAIGDFARDSGILKLRVKDGVCSERLAQHLVRSGFRDAQRLGDECEYYVDLYRRPQRRHYQRSQSPRNDFLMAC